MKDKVSFPTKITRLPRTRKLGLSSPSFLYLCPGPELPMNCFSASTQGEAGLRAAHVASVAAPTYHVSRQHRRAHLLRGPRGPSLLPKSLLSAPGALQAPPPSGTAGRGSHGRQHAKLCSECGILESPI